jgi:pimeloyl-ACP methyl ester carboxylesterase
MPDATINGYKHHWEDAGSGEPFVMLHEALQSSRVFAPQIEELSKTFRVISPDLRGMGQSARVDKLEPPSAWVDDLEALLDQLGIASVHLYGSSIGARVALRFAIDRPGRVRMLILNNPIVAIEPDSNETLNTRMSDPDALPMRIQQLHEAMHGEDWRDVVRNFFAIRNDPSLQEHLNLREAAKGVTIPTLLTRGDSRADTVHPLPHVFELFCSIQTSRMWVKPAGGCFATPEGYDVVRRFIADAAKGAEA